MVHRVADRPGGPGSSSPGLAALYLAGVVAVARQRARRWPVRRTLAFVAGLAVVVVATCSSIAVYDMAMFSAHMLGHLLLVMVAPPLLVAGRPLTLALHATRNPWHRRLRAVVRSRALALWFCPPVALAAYAVVIVGTHLTGLMDVIMARPWAGQIEHLAYLLVGYQFFALVVGEEPLRWRLSMPAKELLLAVAMAVDTFTGVILLQSSQAITMSGGSPTHVDPLAETHLGGAIMWVGGDGIMVVIMIVVAVSWLRRPEYRRAVPAAGSSRRGGRTWTRTRSGLGSAERRRTRRFATSTPMTGPWPPTTAGSAAWPATTRTPGDAPNEHSTAPSAGPLADLAAVGLLGDRKLEQVDQVRPGSRDPAADRPDRATAHLRPPRRRTSPATAVSTNASRRSTLSRASPSLRSARPCGSLRSGRHRDGSRPSMTRARCRRRISSAQTRRAIVSSHRVGSASPR